MWMYYFAKKGRDMMLPQDMWVVPFVFWHSSLKWRFTPPNYTRNIRSSFTQHSDPMAQVFHKLFKYNE